MFFRTHRYRSSTLTSFLNMGIELQRILFSFCYSSNSLHQHLSWHNLSSLLFYFFTVWHVKAKPNTSLSFFRGGGGGGNLKQHQRGWSSSLIFLCRELLELPWSRRRYSAHRARYRTTKQISKMERKPFTSSLNIYPEACCIKRWSNASPPSYFPADPVDIFI